MACSSCKYVEKDSSKAHIVTAQDKKEDLVIIDEHQDLQSLPQIEETCGQCGHTKARYWVVQTRASDEAPTKFIRCEKCGNTWRDYS